MTATLNLSTLTEAELADAVDYVAAATYPRLSAAVHAEVARRAAIAPTAVARLVARIATVRAEAAEVGADYVSATLREAERALDRCELADAEALIVTAEREVDVHADAAREAAERQAVEDAEAAEVRAAYRDEVEHETCEHGLSAWLCAGPQHYPYTGDEPGAY